MKAFNQIIIATLLSVLSMGVANAQNITGRSIVEKSYNRPTGNDQESNLKMTLINNSGSERIRQIKQYSLDNKTVEKSIMFFLSPADVKNTGFMNYSYSDNTPDDQWIYLPALKKVKRISSDSKSDYFMGSDFTYDDLGDRKIDDDTHTLIKEELINKKQCYVVESTSKNKDYMYSKTITWIDKSNFIGVKKEFYDEDGELLKMLEIKRYENISNFDIITHSEMNNVQRNHTTKMELSNVKINVGIEDSKFSQRMLERGL